MTTTVEKDGKKSGLDLKPVQAFDYSIHNLEIEVGSTGAIATAVMGAQNFSHQV